MNHSSQFSVKNSTNNHHNLPLIRNESHDLQVKDNQQRFGNLMQTQHVGSNQGVRASYGSKISQSQGASGGQAMMQGQNQVQSMRMSFTKYGG